MRTLAVHTIGRLFSRDDLDPLFHSSIGLEFNLSRLFSLVAEHKLGFQLPGFRDVEFRMDLLDNIFVPVIVLETTSEVFDRESCPNYRLLSSLVNLHLFNTYQHMRRVIIAGMGSIRYAIPCPMFLSSHPGR